MTFDLSSLGWDEAFDSAFQRACELSNSALQRACELNNATLLRACDNSAPQRARESNQSTLRRFDRSDLVPARVTRVDRGVCTGLTVDGAVRASIGGGLLAAAAQDPLRLPCAGDWA